MKLTPDVHLTEQNFANVWELCVEDVIRFWGFQIWQTEEGVGEIARVEEILSVVEYKNLEDYDSEKARRTKKERDESREKPAEWLTALNLGNGWAHLVNHMKRSGKGWHSVYGIRCWLMCASERRGWYGYVYGHEAWNLCAAVFEYINSSDRVN